MKLPNTSRLHSLRMENDAAGFAMQEQRARFATLAGRHENGTAPRAVTAFQLFQTPPELARRMADALQISPGARVLEPSAGLGRLLDVIPAGCQTVAVDCSSQCTGELYRQNRAGVRIVQRDFLTIDSSEFPLFDFVIMNPPFHMRADIRHINHALTFLKPGGRLCALAMDTHHREKALRSSADTWEQIPSGVFKETGTLIACVMLTGAVQK